MVVSKLAFMVANSLESSRARREWRKPEQAEIAANDKAWRRHAIPQQQQ